MSAESGSAEATTPERAREEIHKLVERFASNLDAYKRAEYKEAQVRVEFIDPFFEALGWDVRNVRGYAEQYKDVVHEDAIKVSGATRAPDYCFRVGGVRKFFLEAKKPAVPVKGDVGPAYQLRRYAWSAKLPLSILTDFEEFAVYDCRQRPKPSDKVSVGRIMYLTFDQYLDRFDDVFDVFAKEPVLKGSFDRYVLDTKRKRGTSEVDVEFLKEIEGWRDTLARNIALRNPALSVYELNFAVQRTIDRIIFLRMCEDRGIEDYGGLLALTGGAQIYARLGELYRQADDKYNSELFDFQADTLTRSLTLDDRVLKPILSGLYYPQCPYEFSVLPPEILGQVYEQFLGKVIRLTPAHRAKVEEKPEVKKAGGVYYTPTYIVEYIVQQTVGKLVEGKTPRQISKQRVLDPACGSGSFLLGAYQYLLDHHRQWYEDHDPAKHARAKRPALYQGPGGEWRLTTGEKKRILLNNIYGVDIDRQAVEVTKLSLLLKVLEGENQETLGQQLALWRERALPDLGDNIKCGNSLIGPDYFEGQLLPDEEEMRRVNPFDWEAEFPEIMAAGGFDSVIGNPPYVRVRVFKGFYPEQVDYLEAQYQCATHVWDVYLLFFERALQLARMGGRIAFIVPIQTLHQPNCESLRRLLLSDSTIATVVDLSSIRVFQRATVKNCILVCSRGRRSDSRIETLAPELTHELRQSPVGIWPQAAVLSNPGLSLKLDLLSPKRDLCEKLRSQSWQLEELCYVTFGLRSCAKTKGGGGKDRLITMDGQQPSAKPYLEGRDIGRYSMRPTGRFISYMPEEMYSPRTPGLFETQKIVSRSMLSHMNLIATLDDQGFYVEQSLVCIIPHGVMTKPRGYTDVPLEFILGIMNSRLESFYFATYIIDYSLGGGLIHATPGPQAKLVIPRTSMADVSRMLALVERMLQLHKKLSAATIPADKELYQRQIEATDDEIDALVYELYGLTDDEIEIVEAGTE